MRTFLISCTAALVATCAPVVAADPPPEPAGRRCHYSAMSDQRPGAPDDRMHGVAQGGPMVGEGTMICTLRVGSNRHDGPYVWRNEQPAIGGVAAFAEELGFDSPEDAQDFMCTSWRRPDGTTLYWRPSQGSYWPWRNDPGQWTTDATAPCHFAVQPSTQPLWDEVDYLVCLRTGPLYTGPYDPQQPYYVYVDDDGDVYVDNDGDGLIQGDEWWWDCPPYQWDDPAADPLQ